MRSNEVSAGSAWAFALSTLMLLGASGCATDTTATDGNTTTSNGNTSDGTTTVDDTSDSAMSETGTDTDDSTSNTTSSAGSFYAVPEDDLSATSCDPFMQDCPDGEKCVPYSSGGETWDANECVPLLGDGEPGEPCTSAGPIEATDSCGETSLCWFTQEIDGELVGVCTELCGGDFDDPQCPEGTSCLISNDNAVNLCLTSCDPLAQDCADGLGCYSDPSGVSVCLPSDGVGVGEPCDDIASCSPSSACVAADALPECAGSSCCAAYCSLTEPSCSQPGTECVPVYADAPRGLEDVGICVAP